MVDIYRAAKRLGKYPPLTTDTEVKFDSSLKEGHVYNHASNYLAVDYQQIVYE